MKDFEELSAQHLDQFVDGELCESARRDVLLAAEREPDAWRRLALAFVQSQTLRHELSALIKPAVNPRLDGVPEVASGAPSGRWVAVLAACCLFAFGLGRWSNPADARIASQPPTPPHHQPTFAAQDDQPNFKFADGMEDAEQHQTLRLVLDDLLGGPPQEVDVPVVNELVGDPSQLLTGPPVISAEIQRALLRAGRRVREQRHLYEVPLSDGRSGFVPVSNVLVENAGLDVFQ